MSSKINPSIVDEIPEEIYKELSYVGIQSHLLGYDYLAYAINMVANDLDTINCVTKGIYPKVAEVFNTTPSRAERAMRAAIDRLFDVGDPEIIYSYFGNSLSIDKYKASNSQFISTVARAVRKKLIHKDELSETQVS